MVRRHGFNTTSFQTLEPGYRYFFPSEDAAVAYVDTGAAWVAAGAPLAAPEALGPSVARFIDAAAAAGRRAGFFAVEQRLLQAAGAELEALQIGEQPVWGPADWPQTLGHHRSLREQLRRARAKGVRVRQLTPTELGPGPLREAISALAQRWLDSRALAPLGFLVHLELFAHPEERRCFVAERGGQLVGFAGLIPVPARRGWFLEDLLRDPAAPSGTSELLVDAAMREAACAGSPWFTLGLAPLSGEVSAPLGLVRRTGGLLYDFRGLRAFKAKLRPSTWTPIYLGFPRGQGSLRSLYDGLVAFTGGGLLRFGLRSLARLGPGADGPRLS